MAGTSTPAAWEEPAKPSFAFRRDVFRFAVTRDVNEHNRDVVGSARLFRALDKGSARDLSILICLEDLTDLFGPELVGQTVRGENEPVSDRQVDAQHLNDNFRLPAQSLHNHVSPRMLICLFERDATSAHELRDHGVVLRELG
jgi:hypothetical protein